MHPRPNPTLALARLDVLLHLPDLWRRRTSWKPLGGGSRSCRCSSPKLTVKCGRRGEATGGVASLLSGKLLSGGWPLPPPCPALLLAHHHHHQRLLTSADPPTGTPQALPLQQLLYLCHPASLSPELLMFTFSEALNSWWLW